MCAVVTRDDFYTRRRHQAHPTAHTDVSPGGGTNIFGQPSHSAQRGYFDSQPNGNRDSNVRGGNYNVVPPIGRERQQQPGVGKGENTGGGFNVSELEDISLKNEVIRTLREVSERALQAMLINLRAQDRDRDGVLSTDHIKGTLKKFQINLSENGLDTLLRRYGEQTNHVHMVRYEQMMTYLTKSRLDALKTNNAHSPQPQPDNNSGSVSKSTPIPQVQQQNSGQQQTHQYYQNDYQNQPQQNTNSYTNQQSSKQPNQQTKRMVNMRNRVLFTDRDEAKLIIDMERQLADKPVNMSDLRRTMYDLDRDRNDFLSGKQVEIALSRCGCYLTPDVRARLLLATDKTGAGIYKIETLLNYLTRVKPEAHSIMLGNNHVVRQARTAKLPVLMNQKSLIPPWEESQPLQRLETQTQFLPDEGFGDGSSTASGNRNDHSLELSDTESSSMPPYDYPVAPEPPALDKPLKPEFDMQKWTNDYQYLAAALYQADQDRSGYSPENDVQHIAKTYSLVYNLNISEEVLRQALRAAHNENLGEVDLEFFISRLQDLHLKEMQSF